MPWSSPDRPCLSPLGGLDAHEGWCPRLQGPAHYKASSRAKPSSPGGAICRRFLDQAGSIALWRCSFAWTGSLAIGRPRARRVLAQTAAQQRLLKKVVGPTPYEAPSRVLRVSKLVALESSTASAGGNRSSAASRKTGADHPGLDPCCVPGSGRPCKG